MLYLVIIILILFSMKFIVLHSKMEWFYKLLKEYMLTKGYLLFLCYCIFNVFWLLVNMYLKVMEFLGKIIISYNNILGITFFSVIRLLITVLFISILDVLNYVRKSYVIFSKKFDVFAVILVLVLILSYLYVWYVIFEIEVFRILVIFIFIYIKEFWVFFINVILKKGIKGFFKNPWYPVVFREKRIDMLLFLIINIDNEIWRYFFSKTEIRYPHTVTAKLFSDLMKYDNAEVLNKLYERIHKGTYIGNMYEAANIIGFDFEEEVKPITNTMLVNLRAPLYFSVNCLGFSNFDFFVRVYFYRKYGNFSIIDYKKQLSFVDNFKDLKYYEFITVSKFSKYKAYVDKNFPEVIVKELQRDQEFFVSYMGLQVPSELGWTLNKEFPLKYRDFGDFKYFKDFLADSDEISQLLTGYYYIWRFDQDILSTKEKKPVTLKGVFSYIYFFFFFKEL